MLSGKEESLGAYRKHREEIRNLWYNILIVFYEGVRKKHGEV